MKRQPLILAAVLLAIVVLVALKQPPRDQPAAADSAGAPAAPAAGGTTAEQAIARARAAGQPVLLSFRSNSCIPCKAMGVVLAELRPKYEGRVAFIDVSLEPDTPDMNLILQHQIQAKPTTVVLASSGEVVESKMGVWEAPELAARLDGLVSR